MTVRTMAFLILASVLASMAVAQDRGFDDYESRQVNGITLAYRDIGNGPPLVLLHGFSSTGAQWNQYLSAFSEGFRLIVPDLRGHGRSLNPSGFFTHSELAKDVFSLLDQLGVEDFSAIGTSMGAMTLLHAATLEPERINSMILIGGTPYLPETARAIYRQIDPDSIPLERLEEMARPHSGGVEQVLQLQRQFSAYKDSYDDVNFTPPLLSSIKADTLIVQGDRDRLFPVQMALEMYDAIPDSYLWVVPNGEHSAGLRSPEGREQFIKTALDFLAGSWGQ